MSSAVLVIDCQVDFCLPEGRLGELGRDFSPILAMLQRLPVFLDQVRRLGIPVILVRTEGNVLCRPGSHGAELCVTTSPSDRLITKTSFDAFEATRLAADLRNLGVHRLAVTGVDTHVCVESTVRRAKDLGFVVDVVSDLVATRGENSQMHAQSLRVMGKYFACITESAQLVARLTGEARETTLTL